MCTHMNTYTQIVIQLVSRLKEDKIHDDLQAHAYYANYMHRIKFGFVYKGTDTYIKALIILYK